MLRKVKRASVVALAVELRDSMKKSLAKKYATMILIPKKTYVFYFDLKVDLLNKLNGLLNNFIRYIFKLRKYDYVSAVSSRLKWLPFIFISQLAIFTYLPCSVYPIPVL